MSRARTAVIAGISTVIVIGAVAAFAAPAASDWYRDRHDEKSSYKTAADAKADRDSFPRWVPDSATGVEYKMKTTGGDRLLKVTLPSASLPVGCTPYKPAADLPGPELKAGWFPESAAGKPTARCGLYYTFLDGDTLYGWQTNSDWIDANKANK